MKRLIIFLVVILLQIPALGDAITFEGIVKPVHEVELALPLDGVIAKIFVKEGDSVKKEEHILKLDDTLQRLEVELRKAVYYDNAGLESDKNNLVILKSLLDSSMELYEKTASVSHDEVKNLQMQYHTLKGRVEGQEAKKKQELLDFELSKEVLERYVLKSPIDGLVTVIVPEEGEWIKTGEMLATVVDVSVCYVEFNIDEKYARTLKKGKAISLKVREGSASGLKKGKVIFVSPVADKASALVKVKVEFENTDGRITPGVLANIIFD